MEQPQPGVIEEELGAIIIDGQRCEIFVRSEPDDDGTWHNALLFRRGGRAPTGEALVAGVSWHVPPGIALSRARELGEQEQIALFRRSLAPRPPLL
ncbi:hypothetical protein BH23GEM10_BH23GEM10_11220 [soil metagenome]